MPLRIVIPGGSGQTGQMLVRHFTGRGDEVTVLSRTVPQQPAAWRVLRWDGRTADRWAQSLEGSDVCINLAGRSVNCRYTPENRREIHNSRTLSTGLLQQVMASLGKPPRVWLNASTATIYRHSFGRDMDEATGELAAMNPTLPGAGTTPYRSRKTGKTPFSAGRSRQLAK